MRIFSTFADLNSHYNYLPCCEFCLSPVEKLRNVHQLIKFDGIQLVKRSLAIARFALILDLIPSYSPSRNRLILS